MYKLCKLLLVCIGYSTIETKEAARIGYNGFLFPHSNSGDALADFVNKINNLATQSLKKIHIKKKLHSEQKSSIYTAAYVFGRLCNFMVRKPFVFFVYLTDCNWCN
jgi:hypothetical protein